MNRTLLALAGVSAIVSGFLLYTLVLEEPYLEHSFDDAVIIGIPGVLAIALSAFACRPRRS